MSTKRSHLAVPRLATGQDRRLAGPGFLVRFPNRLRNHTVFVRFETGLADVVPVAGTANRRSPTSCTGVLADGTADGPASCSLSQFFWDRMSASSLDWTQNKLTFFAGLLLQLLFIFETCSHVAVLEEHPAHSANVVECLVVALFGFEEVQDRLGFLDCELLDLHLVFARGRSHLVKYIEM